MTDASNAGTQSHVLAIGSGPLLAALLAAMVKSGLERLDVMTAPDPQNTGIERFWCEVVRPYSLVVYVSQDGYVDELRFLHSVCRQEKKRLLPALFLGNAGLAGPMLHPDSTVCWESAWRRLHRTAWDQEAPKESGNKAAAGALLANVIVSELSQALAGTTDLVSSGAVYWLDTQTCEGDWHALIPHPLVTGRAAAERVLNIPEKLEKESGSSCIGPQQWFDSFTRITSDRFGIFRLWEEGDLNQLPLSQCRVQATDPISDGPADLLPDIVIAALTHEKARKESALAGVEAHVSRMAGRLVEADLIGVGAGLSLAESVSRGLLGHLFEVHASRTRSLRPSVRLAQLEAVEDECCRYCMHALVTLLGRTPEIGLGEEVYGFPVIWVCQDGYWYGCVGLDLRSALRQALLQAVQIAQNDGTYTEYRQARVLSVDRQDDRPILLEIPHREEDHPAVTLKSALQVLEQNRRRLCVFRLYIEPFLEDDPIMVYGVHLEEVGQ